MKTINEQMEEELTINGKVYTLKKEVGLKDFTIREQCNVLAILVNDKNIGDKFYSEHTFEKNYREYKETPKVEIHWENEEFRKEIIILSKSRYSMNYVQTAINTAKAFLNNSDSPRFFLAYDENKSKFIESQPLVIVIQDMVFLLAPRIEE